MKADCTTGAAMPRISYGELTSSTTTRSHVFRLVLGFVLPFWIPALMRITLSFGVFVSVE